MFFRENITDILREKEIHDIIEGSLFELKQVRKALLIHPDYTRTDFSHIIAPNLLEILKKKGLKELHTLNASGTHRHMTKEEISEKLAITGENVVFHNHNFFDPSQLIKVGELSPKFVAGKTEGEFNTSIPVTVNKMIFDSFDAIFVLSGTLPHEAAGFAGGLKAFIPGISGPDVVNAFHWAAVLIGIPKIIGTVKNPARDIINAASKVIFDRITIPIFSLNMVFEEKDTGVVPKGLYVGKNFEGFLLAYERACEASSKLHVRYINKPLKRAVQVIGEEYDEIWTAAKGSYKLQRPGVILPGGEIIIYAPHIKCFHSNKTMDKWIREIGYHCRDYVKEYLKKHPTFDRNVAAHVINLRGPGSYDPETGEEKFLFKVSLATQIPKEECEAVGLSYVNPDSLREDDFHSENTLWIKLGGKYLYDLKNEQEVFS